MGVVVRIVLTEDAVKWLADAHVYFSNNWRSSRLRAGDVLAFLPETRVEPFCGFFRGGQLCQMGAFSYTSSILPADAVVGRYCSIAKGLSVPGPRHPIHALSASPFVYGRGVGIFEGFLAEFGETYDNLVPNPQKPAPRIGNDVWIGANVTLMPGVQIGDGAVVAANSVVVKDVEPYQIVGGNPAKAIRLRFSEKVVEELLAIQWWQYKFTSLSNISLLDPSLFIDELRSQLSGVEKFAPAQVELAKIPV